MSKENNTVPQQKEPFNFVKWLKELGTLNIIGIVLCIILIPILIVNSILLIKGVTNKDQVPSIGNSIPLIVITESMEPDILAGDIIICKKVDPQTLKEGDVIAFFDPSSKGSSVVTHKINTVYYNDDGTIDSFETYGINNFNSDGSLSYDKRAVPVENVVGIYLGNRIPLVGHIALFMQSTWGLILCIFVPLAIFVTNEILQRKKLDKGKEDDLAKLQAELAALRAQQSQTDATQSKNSEDDSPSV